MANLMPNGKQQYFNNAAAPLAGGRIYTYAAGTTTPKATYTTAADGVENANPVVLNARGEAAIYWDGSYYIEVKDASDELIYTADNYVDPAQTLRSDLLASTGSASVGYVQGGSGARTRTVAQKLQEIPTAFDYATGDGTTDDAAQLAAANTNLNEVVLVAGTYKVGSNTTFSKPVRMLPGAMLSVPTGVTVTFNGGFTAGPYQVFSLTGTAAIKIAGKSPFAFLEWWGALCDGSNDDALAAQKAVDSFLGGGSVELLNRQYTFTTAVSVTSHAIRIRGVTAGLAPIDYGGGGIQGTQIIGTNAVNCITVTNVGYFKLENVTMYLPVGATTACIGLKLDSCFYPKVTDCRITNFSTAIKLLSDTDTYIDRCYLSSTGSTVTPVIGIDIDGTTTQNASVYISNCIAAHATFSGSAYGYYLHGDRINDTLLSQCESAGCTYGFFVDGSLIDAGYGADIHLRACVADGNTTYGFYVSNLTLDTALEISGGWVAGGSSLIYIANSSARVIVDKMQVYGGGNGIYVQGSSQVNVTGNMLLYQTGNCIVIDNSPVCNISNNQGYQKTAAGATFIGLLSGSTHCAIMGNCANASIAGAFSVGILTATGCDYCNVIGNVMPGGGAITTGYSLNLGSNTNTVQLGTTA